MRTSACLKRTIHCVWHWTPKVPSFSTQYHSDSQSVSVVVGRSFVVLTACTGVGGDGLTQAGRKSGVGSLRASASSLSSAPSYSPQQLLDLGTAVCLDHYHLHLSYNLGVHYCSVCEILQVAGMCMLFPATIRQLLYHYSRA